ncbi:MAG TPA: universal stress protein [Chloroflexota bacterium]|nr:universal stress protein [Chloroflexota bacterium]
MFKRILVPLDGTPQANAALLVASTVAKSTGAAMTLLRVLPATESSGDRAAIFSTLEKVAIELTCDGLQVEPALREGEIVPQILEQARARSIDLIVMRSHGRVGLGRAVLGSVTERVLAASGVPVLVVRPGGRRVRHLRTLLVPVDGSPGGAVALGTAVGLSQASGASIKLLRVAVPIPEHVYTDYDYAAIPDFDPAAWDEEALASAGTYVDDIVARLRGAGVPAEGVARMAPEIAKTIVSVAQETSADVIVMSTQALTGAARALLGSVADAVVRGAHCPVLLLRRTEIDRETGAHQEPLLTRVWANTVS